MGDVLLGAISKIRGHGRSGPFISSPPPLLIFLFLSFPSFPRAGTNSYLGYELVISFHPTVTARSVVVVPVVCPLSRWQFVGLSHWLHLPFSAFHTSSQSIVARILFGLPPLPLHRLSFLRLYFPTLGSLGLHSRTHDHFLYPYILASHRNFV